MDELQPPSAVELFSLAGTVALVTGATRGIGLSTARLLASAGATTVLTGLPEEQPERVASALANEGLPVVGRTCDARNESRLREVVQFALSEYGRIDTVVANAGVALDSGTHLTSTDEQLDAMFDLHVRGVLRLANLAIPPMADGGGGSFLVMSSIAGLRGNRMLGLYGITKAANAQLARNLAVQWGDRNVRVNAISPGVIDTDFAKPITDNGAVALIRLARTPLHRFGHAHHVAGTVLWLASEAGAFTTGQNIVVDGGTLIAD
ncbi:SDR family NAD(P)-dependent oxidoreductase [Lysobacter korlensis]|uniref:SDR family NAD(P)-dependent oxidoreductase n=1 Tax=Lysobacter korlensis TaxID=553636 RepID=A0ABV6RX69_9GAMM